MEVIKIPWEHVDPCLFFRPGGRVEGCQDAALSISQQESVWEKNDLVEDEGDERGVKEEEEEEEEDTQVVGLRGRMERKSYLKREMQAGQWERERERGGGTVRQPVLDAKEKV